MTTTIPIVTASRRYQALVGPGLLAGLPAHVRTSLPNTRRIAVFADAGLLSQQVPQRLVAAFAADGYEVVFDPHATVIHPTEPAKNLGTLERLLVAMAGARLDRNDAVVALGGGIVGDTVGFAAATYRRGIAWINCPSTLLAMVDASVGGKTAVNLATPAPTPHLHKNMIGAFWQPSLVVADTSLLVGLPDRALRCGLAECIKHGMLSGAFGDAGLFAWIRANLGAVLTKDSAVLTELIARNIAVKAAVIVDDEREESGAAESGRALLNLGHTFGHAIETIGHLYLQHGEAVGLGLIAASAAAGSAGLAPHSLCKDVRSLVAEAGLPTSLQHLPGDDQLLSLMFHDKKVAGGRLRLILPKGDGTCVVVTDPPAGTVGAGWKAIRV